MNTPEELEKIAAFGRAMDKYQTNPLYKKLELLNSWAVLSLQIANLVNLFYLFKPMTSFTLVFVLIFAWIATDFINGLVHMFMDNNTQYSSMAGPLIAAFHMHHARPQYRERHPLQVYFFESGTKFWLSAYLLILLFFQKTLPFSINATLVFVGILSSLAEVSHYWCHVASSRNRIILRLQKYRILLSKKHHSSHHRSDNNQYAFLNGITDPLLDKISRCFYSGYKNHADKHTRIYLNKKAE